MNKEQYLCVAWPFASFELMNKGNSSLKTATPAMLLLMLVHFDFLLQESVQTKGKNTRARPEMGR